MNNPKPQNESLDELHAEYSLSEEQDSFELTELQTTYKLNYNHPMGSSVANILIGMIASLLDGNAGATITILGSLVILSIAFFKELIVFILLFIASLGFCYLTVALIYRDTTLSIDDNGIKFPTAFFGGLRFAPERSWQEIRGVKFANITGNTLEDDRILIAFYDGAIVKLDIDGFSRSSLKKFVLLLNTYRPDIVIRSDFSDLLQASEGKDEIRMELLSAVSDTAKDRKEQSKKAISFTKIWEAELNSRYSTTAYTPLECGDSLADDNYKVLGQIAFGGLSAIYLAEDSNESLVVLKESVLPESSDEDTKKKALEMFQREAQLLCGINHRSIASVHDYFVYNDRHYMVLQHMDGRTVRDYVNEFGPQREEQTIRWAFELALTVSYLHNLEPPIIHKDLTPDNIIVRKDGSISIIDFGAANNFIGTATCTVVGKSSYIPLEQFQGKANLCSDIYAFGATLYFMLTNRDPEPFSQGDLDKEGMIISSGLNNLIKDCTEVKSEERIQSIDELVERLSQMKERRSI